MNSNYKHKYSFGSIMFCFWGSLILSFLSFELTYFTVILFRLGYFFTSVVSFVLILSVLKLWDEATKIKPARMRGAFNIFLIIIFIYSILHGHQKKIEAIKEATKIEATN